MRRFCGGKAMHTLRCGGLLGLCRARQLPPRASLRCVRRRFYLCALAILARRFILSRVRTPITAGLGRRQSLDDRTM